MFRKIIGQDVRHSFKINNQMTRRPNCIWPYAQPRREDKFFPTFSPYQRDFYMWKSPREPRICHPADIIAVILSKQSLESESNAYVHLENHITGNECGFSLHARIALSIQYPQLLKYAKLHAENEQHLNQSMSHAFIQNVSKFPDCDPEKLNLIEITTQIAADTRSLLAKTINTHVIKDIEKQFGKKIMVCKFIDQKVISLTEKVMVKQADLLSYDFEETHRMQPTC